MIKSKLIMRTLKFAPEVSFLCMIKSKLIMRALKFAPRRLLLGKRDCDATQFGAKIVEVFFARGTRLFLLCINLKSEFRLEGVESFAERSC